MSEGSNKRKKSFYKGKYGSKKGRYDSELRPKLKGFILTCNGQERSATLEAYRILNEYADQRYGPETKETVESEPEDIENALEQQISSIKASSVSKERRFQTVQNKAKNVIFIKTTLDNPAELVKDIFDDLASTDIAKTKYCCKLLPVVETCYAKTNHILEAAKPILENFFTASEKPFTYCIMWKTRCNSSIKRDDVYPDLVKIIQEFENDHTVSYNDPDVAINIDIIGNICCFSFLWYYHKNGKYNIDTVSKKNATKPEEIVDKQVKEIPCDSNSEELTEKLDDVSNVVGGDDTLPIVQESSTTLVQEDKVDENNKPSNMGEVTTSS